MASKNEVQQKKEYAENFLKAEPGMSVTDVNHYLGKKFGSGLAASDINDIRKKLGFEIRGRGRGQYLVNLNEEEAARQKALAEQTQAGKTVAQEVTAQRQVATTPSVTVTPARDVAATAPAVTKTMVPPTAARAASVEEDDAYIARLANEIQQVMSRRNYLLVSIGRTGQVHIEEVAQRDIALPATRDTAHH